MTFAQIMPYLYMVMFIVIGWRLYVIRWHVGLRIVSGAAMIIAPPLLFILPALRRPEGNMADLLVATGVGMFFMGLLCTLGGVLAAYLNRRFRRA